MATSVTNCELAEDSKTLSNGVRELNNAPHAPTPPGHNSTWSVTASTRVETTTHVGGDTSMESGEGTPSRLAPEDPTHQDPGWPEVLADCVEPLISAVRETSSTRAQSTRPSLPSDTSKDTPPSVTENQQGSNLPVKDSGGLERPPNRDHHPSSSSSTLQRSNNNTPTDNRACGTHDTSGDHCLGDWEMPKATTAKTHKILPQKPAWHSDRQSLNPPTAWPHAHTSSPPDEDSLPKRVADSERYHKQHNPTRQGLCPSTNNRKSNTIHISAQHSVTVKAHTSATVTPHSLPNSSQHLGKEWSTVKLARVPGPLPLRRQWECPSAHRRSYMQPPSLTWALHQMTRTIPLTIANTTIHYKQTTIHYKKYSILITSYQFLTTNIQSSPTMTLQMPIRNCKGHTNPLHQPPRTIAT